MSARTGWWQALLHRCDLNLAPFRYERVLHKDGGPIEHLDRATHHVREGIVYNVNAFLDERLKPVRRLSQLYGMADGGGTHSSEIVARFMAISEAMERWAFWDRSDSSSRDLYGFDIDSTTTGMAAFPGLMHHQAKRRAQVEAIERFGLLHWWEGRLAHLEHRIANDGVTALEILVPTADTRAVVVFEDDAAFGTRHYGYGAGGNLKTAIGRAASEMIRHRLVVQKFCSRFPDPGLGLATIEDPYERRALYFALPMGQALFDERRASDPWAAPARLRSVFDGWIPGPWDRYATVWRCLYEPPSNDYQDARSDYFFW